MILDASSDLVAVATELDIAHERAHSAFRRRDLNTYVAGFAPDLAYTNLEGRIYTRADIGQQVEDQMKHLVAADMRFVRERLTLEAPLAIELVTQTARVAIRIAFAFARRWSLHRRGRYTWRRGEQGWIIAAVEVLEERVTGDGFGLAKATIYEGAV